VGRECATSDDDGFSLIEVVVAMMLLALLALVTLPLFMTGLRITAANGSETTATDQVAAVLEQARVAPNCTGLKSLAAAHQPSTFTDAQGRQLRLTVPTPTCTPGTAAAVTLTASATNASGTTVSTATTMIYVSS